MSAAELHPVSPARLGANLFLMASITALVLETSNPHVGGTAVQWPVMSGPP